MIGDLAAAVGLDHRDITRTEQVLGLAGLALGEHGRMLDHPELGGGILIARVGEISHRLPGGQVVASARAGG